MVAVIRPPADLTPLRAASTSRDSNPVRAIAPPKAIAFTTKPIVVSMLLMPPLDRRESSDSFPLTEV